MSERVTTEFMDKEVLRKDAAPFVLYVTGEGDVFLPHLCPILEQAILESEASLSGNHKPISLIVMDGLAPESIEFAERFQVLFFPTIFIFRRGQVQQVISGFIPEEVLRDLMSAAMKPSNAEAMSEDIAAMKAENNG